MSAIKGLFIGLNKPFVFLEMYINLLPDCQSLTTPLLHLGLKPQAIG
jgi:hypothetical protein